LPHPVEFRFKCWQRCRQRDFRWKRVPRGGVGSCII